MLTRESFVQQLLLSVPELRTAYNGHVAAYDKLLPHVFMGEVTRFAIVECSKPEPRTALARLFEQIEAGLTMGSDQVTELIAVSFVEKLCGEDALRILAPAMGPCLTKELQMVCR